MFGVKDNIKKKLKTKKQVCAYFKKLEKKSGTKVKSAVKKISKSDIKKFSKNIKFEKQSKGKLKELEKLVASGKTQGICRGAIGEGFIKDLYKRKDTYAILASINDIYIGFIIYSFGKTTSKEKYVYLDLVCTAKVPELKGIPLGQILIKEMEKQAKKRKVYRMKARAVKSALPFYKKTGWRESEEIEISKSF